MKYAIPKSNIKVFHKALHSLGKIGGDLFFEPANEALYVKALNSSKTAYFVYSFLASFFTFVEGNLGPNAGEPFRCKIQLRSLQMAFNSVFQSEKTVDSCLVTFNHDSCKLLITRMCRNDVISEYSLPTLEHDTLKVEYTQSGNSSWMLNSKVLSEVISAFLPSHDEAVMTVTPERFHIKNFVDSVEDKEQTHTDFSMYPVEFDEYSIVENTSFLFSLKEFRSMIGFAEATVLPVKATFSTGGNPITFSIKQDQVLEVTYALATMPDTDDAVVHKLVKTPQAPGVRSRNRSNESNASINQQRHSTQMNLSISVMPPPSLTPIPERNGRLTAELESRLTSQGEGRLTGETESSFTADEVREPEPPATNNRKSDIFQEGNGDADILLSPQQKRPRRPKVFSKCFDATVNPAKLSAGTRILAEDSDPDDS